MYDYAGPFQVQLVAPPNVPGFTADPVTIPAGGDEVKVILKVAATAAMGNRPDLSVKATAMVNGNVPTVQSRPVCGQCSEIIVSGGAERPRL
jgi:hypothetical protein